MLRTETEVAEKIRKSLSWLQHMRQTGGGPRYLKIGHAVRYRDEDVDAWLEQQLRQKVWQFDDKKRNCANDGPKSPPLVFEDDHGPYRFDLADEAPSFESRDSEVPRYPALKKRTTK